MRPVTVRLLAGGLLVTGAALLGMNGRASRTAAQWVRVLRYTKDSLTLVFGGDRLVSFQLDQGVVGQGPLSQGQGRRPGDEEVVPGTGAMGLRFGDTRAAAQRRFGRPSRSYGFSDRSGDSGVDVFYPKDAMVTVTITNGGVSQISAYGLPFTSPAGFRSGMALSAGLAALGSPQGEEAHLYHRVGDATSLGVALLALGLALVGAAALALTSLPLGRVGLGQILGVGAGLCLLAHYLRLAPLLAPGLYPVEIAPTCGAASWALTWMGAVLVAGAVAFYAGKPKEERPRSVDIVTITALTTATVGAVVGNLLARLLCSLCALGGEARILYNPLSSSGRSTWGAILIVGALSGAALGSIRLLYRAPDAPGGKGEMGGK